MSSLSFTKPPIYQCGMELSHKVFSDFFCEGSLQGRSLSQTFWGRFFDWGCPFCQYKLQVIESREIQGFDEHEWVIGASQEVTACFQCGWWEYLFSYGTDLTQANRLAIGCVLRPEDARLWVPVPIIREFLHRHPQYLRAGVDPVSLEQVLRDVFSDYFDCEVHWTGRGPDGGFDLYHVSSDSGATLYQIKRRSYGNKSESVVALRSLLGTMLIRGAVSGIFVTTADKFSQTAEKEAELAKERGYKLQLIDYSKLLDILKNTLPKNRVPWRALWDKHSAAYSDFEKRIRRPIREDDVILLDMTINPKG